MKAVFAIAVVVTTAHASSNSHAAARYLGDMSELTPTYLAAVGAARTDDAALVHVLNRVAFGPPPADVENVRTLGVDRYIDQQLHPDRPRDHPLAPRPRYAPT